MLEQDYNGLVSITRSDQVIWKIDQEFTSPEKMNNHLNLTFVSQTMTHYPKEQRKIFVVYKLWISVTTKNNKSLTSSFALFEPSLWQILYLQKSCTARSIQMTTLSSTLSSLQWIDLSYSDRMTLCRKYIVGIQTHLSTALGSRQWRFIYFK